MKIPIFQGILRGKWWIVGSGTHDCWIGCYENRKQQKMRTILKKGGVFYDIGANVGFYTLFGSSLVGPEGKVYAFEPLPRNLKYLYCHLNLNKITNVKVFECAVSNQTGQAFFDESVEPSMGKISSIGKILVNMISLDELYNEGKIIAPDSMKIDVEGAEYWVLTGALRILKNSHPIIFLATHGKKEHQDCCNFLIELGYHVESIDGKRIDETREIIAL